MPVVVQQLKKATVKRGGPDGFCPLFECEHCDERIEPGSTGRACWRMKDSAAYRDVDFVHADCFDRFEERRNTRLKTMPLDDFARHLAHNLGAGEAG